MRTLIVLVCSLLLLLPQAVVAKEDWIKLAEKTVDYKAEVDTVQPRFAEKNITSIKLKCIQGSVNLKQIVITMGDGEVKTVDNLGILTKGLSSRSISIPKGDSKIKTIELSYDSIGNQTLGLAGLSKKGKVEVLGRKSKQSE
ncbi:hypothetical protein [Shewanella waksmanii]|uniref:hypothetical protein n=1 Tax=Shewanella waksmanii TaxID=213783 RepID=UPI0037351DC4